MGVGRMRSRSAALRLLNSIAVAAIAVAACVPCATQATRQGQSGSQKPALHIDPSLVDVTVTEGTSMAVAVSPDGKTLAIDLQGSIYTLPASGGKAKRITSLFEDARQPVWSPDGKWITFFAYLDGNYNLWTIAPDGTEQHQLTWGAYDDREPAYSHDGRYVAFASDRDNPLGGSYNIWVLEVATGAVRRITNDPSENHMPSWSPDDKEIAFASTREDGRSIWAVNIADGEVRKAATASSEAAAPSWGPDGTIVYHNLERESSSLEAHGKKLTGDENAFAFRVSWAPDGTREGAPGGSFYYVSDGKIRRRTLGGASVETIPFSAVLQVRRVNGTYVRRKRDFDSTAPRKALGIVRPVISPEGTRIAFAALGDIYVMPVGGKPENITRDRYVDTDPAWSPDGNELVYSSDKGRDHLQLWIRDLRTGRDRELTHLGTQPQGASWSPDGRRIAFFDVNGIWRAAQMSVVDVATGKVTKLHDTLNAPGMPTWSPDGTRLAFANIAPYSKTVREGTNQVFTISAVNGAANPEDIWYLPIPNLSIDSRGYCGPVWSPDGRKMAAIYEGVLAVWLVSPKGEPLGPPRKMTTEIAYAPSWAGDSRHILYQSLDKLKEIDILSGETQEIPLNLTYRPAIPSGTMVVHVGLLVDGISQTARRNMDIVIERNRITAVRPHTAKIPAGAKLIDASEYTAMPGLIESHSHLQKDYGEALHRAWLAFGITTVRSPGNTPYEGVEDVEANESGVRPGPRLFSTGYLFEWRRTYYKMGVAISSPAQFEMELELSKVLQHDLIKSYVRLPDLQQRRMVEFAHSIGIPVATHEIYPAAYVGVDATEHVGATSRRVYSPKQATLQRSYQDVVAIFGASQRYLTPTVSAPGLAKLFEMEPEMRDDPRFTIYSDWLRDYATGRRRIAPGERVGAGSLAAVNMNSAKLVIDAMHAGARIVAGTDTPNAFALHGELETYVMAGMTPYEALQAATVTPAGELNLDAGSIKPGKLADVAIVEGNPLDDIANAHRVKEVIANGRLFTVADLVAGNIESATQPEGAAHAGSKKQTRNLQSAVGASQ
jgi:Tol biopolymer transport system component